MTKVRKQKRKKRFRANVNRKRLRNKLQKLPKIECEEIENSWEPKRSIRTNLRDMGLAYDPNEVLKISSNKRGTIKIDKLGKTVVEIEDDDVNDGDSKVEKIHVVDKLEADAKAPRVRLFRLPKSQVHFVTYLMDKYGDDYKAMARDRKNHYQMTWCQIRAKINTFKSIPEQYAEYLLKTGEIVLDDPTPLEETRRQIGEENRKKYNVPKKRKIVVQEPKISVWDVDATLESEEIDSKIRDKNSDDSQNKKKKISENGAKKLKLFSDDELSDDEDTKKSSNLKTNKNKNSKIDKNNSKKLKRIEKSQSSDSDSDDDGLLEGEEGDVEGFVNLSDISDEEELSEEDVLDDGEFVTDSNEDSD